jgi:hypothetical protein
VYVGRTSAQPQQHLPESDQKQLCLSCLAANEVSANFCAKCGAPLTSYASTGPFESLFAGGAVYRQAATHPRKLIVVVGVWLIFGTVILSGLTVLNGPLAGKYFGAAGGLVMIAVSGAMIWKTTRNYLAWKHADRKGADAAGHPLSHGA